ncbi:hypothetical protein ZIOFF_001627 [Zingiber officinale]|uniref:DUF4216 domain-containing protein n=1 Tax=Zingiber officinale TaxID=94328 RepID=A0A8J5IKA3_ZINOF|nr:hypothetical protein ZIOFF_001627 [Zingiber officinale]
MRTMPSYGKPELRELDLAPLLGSDVLRMTLNKNVIFGKSNASKPNVDRVNERIDDLDLRVLSRGPNPVAFSYHGFNINGFAFRTVESEKNKKVQNSGVMVQAMHDNDDHESIYYGRLTDIISLDYGGRGRIVLFQCDWVNIATVENEVMSSSQSQQRKRGKTIMRDIHALHPDHVLVVEFNEREQPYGDLQPTLANFIGTIARNGLVLPLHFLDWRKMPANRLNDAWKLVTARFYIPNHHRRVIMQMMGAAWRRWRTEVKATSYDSNTSLEELVAIQPIPHGLTPQTWEVLCNYWKSTESQENGRKPSRIEIQQLSRRSRKKGGAAIDDEAIRIENLLKEVVDRLLQDKPEGTQPLEVHEEAFR